VQLIREIKVCIILEKESFTMYSSTLYRFLEIKYRCTDVKIS